VTGLDIELLQLIGSKAERPVSHVQRAWPEQLAALREGSQDLAIGFRTPEREAFAHFSDPFRVETNVLYIRREDRGRFAFDDLDDLFAAVRSGAFRLGVVEDYAYGPDAMRGFLQQEASQRHLFAAPDDRTLFNALFTDRIDGFLADRTVAATLAWRNDWQDRVREHPCYRNQEEIFVFFSKQSVSLAEVERFNAALAQTREDGSYQRVVRTYLTPVLLSMTVSRDWFFFIDVFGTIAFAISGLLLARRGGYSIFGALVLAALPAIGGGVIRDLLINRHPIGVLRTPVYMTIIVTTVLLGYIFFRLHDAWKREEKQKGLRKKLVAFGLQVVELFDALGLAAFTVTGVVLAVEAGVEPLLLWGPLLAALTGAGGGIVRDVVRADVENPSLKTSFYAEIAFIWGMILSLFLVLQTQRSDPNAILFMVLFTMAGAFLTRVLVVVFKFRAPRF
jgi:polar amino acid transport system substrate-binding protein